MKHHGRRTQKKFIDKKAATTYNVVHRSQQDGAFGLEDRPSERVLLAQAPVNAARRARVTRAGFADDGYDYERHLRAGGGGVFVGADGSVSKAAALPPEALPGEQELERAVEAVTLDDRLMDADVRDALFDDAAFEDCEELLDDFVIDASRPAADEPAEFDFDAHVARLIAAAEGAGEDEDEDDASFDAAPPRAHAADDAAFDAALADWSSDDDDEDDDDEDDLDAGRIRLDDGAVLGAMLDEAIGGQAPPSDAAFLDPPPRDRSTSGRRRGLGRRAGRRGPGAGRVLRRAGRRGPRARGALRLRDRAHDAQHARQPAERHRRRAAARRARARSAAPPRRDADAASTRRARAAARTATPRTRGATRVARDQEGDGSPAAAASPPPTRRRARPRPSCPAAKAAAARVRQEGDEARLEERRGRGARGGRVCGAAAPHLGGDLSRHPRPRARCPDWAWRHLVQAGSWSRPTPVRLQGGGRRESHHHHRRAHRASSSRSRGVVSARAAAALGGAAAREPTVAKERSSRRTAPTTAWPASGRRTARWTAASSRRRPGAPTPPRRCPGAARGASASPSARRSAAPSRRRRRARPPRRRGRRRRPRRRGGPGRQSRLNLSMISFSCASFCAVMRFFGAPAGREKSSVRGGGGSSSESPPRSRAGGGAGARWRRSRTDARSSASRSCDSSRMRCASRARSRSKRFSSVFWSLGRARRSRRSRRSSPLVISLTSATMASARRRSSASASGGTSATAGRGLGLPIGSLCVYVRELVDSHSSGLVAAFWLARAMLTLPPPLATTKGFGAPLQSIMCRGTCRDARGAAALSNPRVQPCGRRAWPPL